MKESSASGQLKGLAWEGSTIRRVEHSRKGAAFRALVLRDGTRTVVSKGTVADLVQQTVSARCKAAAQRSLRTAADGTTTVRLGGPVKGVRHEYKTAAAAKAAITRRYPKAP